MTATNEHGMVEGVRTIWPKLPTRRELELYFSMRPGCEYLWCLWNNIPHAEQVEGWSTINLNHTNGSTPLPRFKVAGHNVTLLARGRPIPGASPNSSGIPIFIDPELEKALGLAQPALPPLPPLPPKPDAAGAKGKSAPAPA